MADEMGRAANRKGPDLPRQTELIFQMNILKSFLADISTSLNRIFKLLSPNFSIMKIIPFPRLKPPLTE
jgi:hypothetical protein